jgi:hypothetical protein
VDAPEAVRAADVPAQIDDADALILTDGAALTVMVWVAEAAQPVVLVPVTLYIVVADGLTVMLAVVAPLLHT